jgi:hypothetical protein
MATFSVYLRPNGNGGSHQCQPDSLNNYTRIDEDPANDSDYVHSGYNSGPFTDYYTMDVPPSSNRIITHVIPYARGYRDSSTLAGSMEWGLRIGTTNYTSSIRPSSSSFVLYAGTNHTINPSTGTSWAWIDLNSIKGVLILSGYPGEEMVSDVDVLCSQFYIKVDYTIAINQSAQMIGW